MSDNNDVFDELENRSQQPGQQGDYADWWEPEEDDHLVGLVVEMHSEPEDWVEAGEVPDPVYTVLALGRGTFDEGELVTPKQHVQLKQGLEGAGVDDLVNIEYKGLQRTDSGNAANNYEVGVIHEDEWREMSGADEIAGVLEAHNGIRGDNTRDEPYRYKNDGGSDADFSDAGDDAGSSDGEFMEAVGFAESFVIDRQDGDFGYDLFCELLTDTRGFDVDPDGVIEAAGLEVVDGDEERRVRG